MVTQHPAIDHILYTIANCYVLKGQLLVLFFWWMWFQPHNERNTRTRLIATILGCVVALALGRFLVWSLPFRVRPMENPLFQFHVPFPIEPRESNSFPSDHAILFVGFATGLYLASRGIGLLALSYVMNNRLPFTNLSRVSLPERHGGGRTRWCVRHFAHEPREVRGLLARYLLKWHDSYQVAR
jgi:hypothetical protein